MKLVSFKSKMNESRVGVLQNDQIVDITTLLKYPVILEDVAALLQAFDGEDVQKMIQEKLDEGDYNSVPLSEITLLAPIRKPRNLRDAAIFEKHVAAASAQNNTTIPASWYEKARFFFASTSTIYGPGEAIVGPAGTKTLDYEAELCLIIGKSGKNVTEETAMDHLFGLTIMNDWSDRALCLDEVGFLGMHKSKDFAYGVGPYVVTMDEVENHLIDGKLHLKVEAWVNGEKTTDSSTDDMYWTLSQLIARVGKDTVISASDMIGLGTVADGSLFDKGPGNQTYLVPGDVVKIAIEGLGELEQSVK